MASLHDASFYCITENELPTNSSSSGGDLRDVYVKISVTFACLGIFGAVWQLLSWRMAEKQLIESDRKRRTVSPTIAVSLAAANFLSCLGVVARATGILVTSPPNITLDNQHHAGDHPENSCIMPSDNLEVVPTVNNETVIIGTAIEIFTNWMYAASVMWTLAYAVDVYSRIRKCLSEAYKMPSAVVYHVICWGVPAMTTMGGTLAIWVGANVISQCAGSRRVLLRYLFCYIPIVFVLIVTPFIYWRAHAHGKKLPRRTGTYSHMEWDIIRMLKVKFLIIVLVYTICWLPNIADSIVQLIEMAHCVTSDGRYKVLFPFWALEAILNPLQGLFNCLLYRRGMFGCVLYSRGKSHQTIQSSIEEHESRLLLGPALPAKNSVMSYNTNS